MIKRVGLLLLLLIITITVFGQKISRKEYIQKYQLLAQKEMKRTGIPASITMSQALLESADGNSTLAKSANNHFGVKCHKWNGPTIKHNDDKNKECFRKYKNPEESYIDHSDFLALGSRYKFLFDLKHDDYKAWARGLKKAGYATNSHYDNLLIKIIEDNELYLLDQGISINKKEQQKREHNIDSENWEIDIYNTRKIDLNNRIKFVYAKDGDTFYSLAKELKVMEWQLYKYNELPKESTLEEGQIIYLQPKRRSAERGNKVHISLANETMYSISQKYGVKLNKLYKKNSHIQQGVPLIKGTKIYLRKKDRI